VIIEPQVCTEEDFKKFMETVYPELMGLATEKKDSDRRREEDREKRKEGKRNLEFQGESLEDLQNEILSGLEVQQ
jgi:hypothetical protein